MKATLEFNLPEEMIEMQQATMAGELAYTLRHVDEQLRMAIKHMEESRYPSVMQECRQLINETLEKLL